MAYRGTSLRSWFQKKVLRYAAPRLIGALRFARGLKKSASLRRFAANRGTLLRSWLKNMIHSPLRGVTGTSLRSWFQKKVLRYAASRLIGALRLARSSRKKCFTTPLRGLWGHFASLSKIVLRYVDWRLIGALRFARGLKKMPPTYGNFEFFFLKIPPILKLEVGFFSDRKVFEIFSRNTVNDLSIN